MAWFLNTDKLKQTKDGEDLFSPSALTAYYMDTFLCNDYHLKANICLAEYEQMSYLRMLKRRKHHRECMGYLDEYKACLIGIN